MKRLINFRFMYPVALGMVIGILSSDLFFKENTLALLLLNFFSILFLFVFFKDFKQIAIILLFYTLFFILGFLIYRLRVQHYLSLNMQGGTAIVKGQVESVSFTNKSCYAVLKNTVIDKGYKLKNTKVLVIIEGGQVSVGQKIRFVGELSNFNFSNVNNYSKSGLNLTVYTFFQDYSSLTVSQGKINIFEKINLFIKDRLFLNLDNNSAGICYGLLTGNTSFVSLSNKDIYKMAGIAHIFSVSGLHVSFLSHFLSKITEKVNIKKIYKSTFIILIILLYSGVCSFSISSLRAVIMCSCLLICSSFGEKYDIINGLLFSLVLVLVINPCNIFSVGLHLSYLSVIGIIVLNRKVKLWFKFLPDKIASSLSISISATLFTFPILLKTFGYFSVLSIFYNLIIIPIIYVLFLSLVAFVLVGIIIPKLVIYKFCKWLVWLINLIKYTYPQKFIIKKTLFAYSFVPYYLATTIQSEIVNLNKKYKFYSSFCLYILALICILGS